MDAGRTAGPRAQAGAACRAGGPRGQPAAAGRATGLRARAFAGQLGAAGRASGPRTGAFAGRFGAWLRAGFPRALLQATTLAAALAALSSTPAAAQAPPVRLQARAIPDSAAAAAAAAVRPGISADAWRVRALAGTPVPLGRFPGSAAERMEQVFLPLSFLGWVEARTGRLEEILERERRALRVAYMRPGWMADSLAGGQLAAGEQLAPGEQLAAAGRLAAGDSLAVGDTLAAAGQAAADTVRWLIRPMDRDSLRAARDSLRVDQPGVEVTDELLGEALSRYADLGMEVTGTGDFGGSWTRYSPCDPSLPFNCDPGLIPRLQPTVDFSLRVGGTVSERIHLDVDYNQTREDFGSQNINVWYQGFEDEVLQRVEVGDVSLRLPASRYIGQGIPAGNFGFRGAGRLGPMDFQAVWAQQRGDVTTREFKLGGAGAQQSLVQDEELELDDADYARGQFFYLAHPDSLGPAPHLDPLRLVPEDAPATLRPDAGGTLQVFVDERYSAGNAQEQASLGFFLADALPAGSTSRHSGLFRRLTPGEDYYLHSSGLWLALRAPLRPDEALAVAYVTAAGDTVGHLNAESAPAGTTPELRLIRGAQAVHQPGQPTWPFEMHSVYRVRGTEVDVETLELDISLGGISAGRTFTEANGEQTSFIQLFGLDEQAPLERLDRSLVWQPGGADPVSASREGITGTFVFFPTLEPFRAPPPSRDLTAAEAAAALGGDGNAEIYTEPDPVTRQGSGRFRLNFRFRTNVEGLRETFSLGTFGIREGSERIVLGNRPLQREVDYEIDYTIGMVTLRNAAALFAANPDAELRVTLEQQALFNLAPTSVFGMNTTFQMGQRGTVDLMGIYQSEKNIYARPELGTEPGAALVAGVKADLDLGGAGLHRLLSALPGLRLAGESSVQLSGEAALSAPDPNSRGAAYLDDFEGTDATGLSENAQDWKLGSAPGSRVGAEGVLPLNMDAASADSLVWQHLVQQAGGTAGGELPGNIDRAIQVAGAAQRESVLWLTMGGRGVPPAGQRWRSMTTVLSSTGRDLSRAEYLELYVNSARPMALVLDLGSVSEDAFYLAPDGATNGTYEDGRPWGLGVLDEEARLAEREVWGTTADARGLWDQPCQVRPLEAHPLGAAAANCTRGNGVPDTEDLDGNGVLDATDGAYFRYVVQLGPGSPYLARDTAETGTAYRLYRIPLRSTGTPVNGASDATWRFVKHLRMTVAGDHQGAASGFNAAIARPRIVGSRWAKRDVTGVRRGLLDDEEGLSAATARVQVGPAGRLTDGGAYSSPPGVIDQLQDPTQGVGAGGVEFNEKGLRLRYEELGADERAEVYFRYPQTPRNFLDYRQLRLWAVAREGDWGPDGSETLLVKVGTDARNFYLYRAPLNPATGGSVAPGDWTPELVIEFAPWLELRRQAEERLVVRGPLATQDTLWNEAGTHAVVLEERGRAPNLAAVRELSLAVHNAAGFPATGEVWLNDIRLDAPYREPGAAGQVDFTVQGGDFMDARLSLDNRGARFRQLNQDARYVTNGNLAFSSTANLGRMLPAGWGVALPVSVRHARTADDPYFLQGGDVLAGELEGLRETGSSNTDVVVNLRREAPSANPLVSLLVDGMALSLRYNTAETNGLTQRAEAHGLTGGLSYRRQPAVRTLDPVPAPLEGVVRALLPGFIQASSLFQRIAASPFRWSPTDLAFGGSYEDRNARSYRFNRILTTAEDSAVKPTESPRVGLNTEVGIGFRPFSTLSMSADLRTARDLLDPARAATVASTREALARARGELAGMDVGWEVDRSVATRFSYEPRIFSWLAASYRFDHRFGQRRDAANFEEVVAGADTVAELQRRFNGDRTIDRRLELSPAALADALLGPPDSAAGGPRALAHRALGAVQDVRLQWRDRLASRYEQETNAPDAIYQFGVGGLDHFRFLKGETASSATDERLFEVQGGVNLPASLSLTVRRSESTGQSLDVRGGLRDRRSETWPSLTLNAAQLPVPGWLQGTLRQASASVGYEETLESTVLGRVGDPPRTAETTRLTPTLRLTLGQGITMSYRGSLTDRTGREPTGRTERTHAEHNLELRGSITPPEGWRERLRGSLNPSLTVDWLSTDECRVRAAAVDADACVPYIDLNTRRINFNLDTNLSDLMVGVRVSHNANQNNVGTATGSNQFSIGFFGQFRLSAGRFPETRAPGLPGIR